MTCKIDGCSRAVYCRGFCNGCYQRALAAGLPRLKGAGSLAARFWAKVRKTPSCWLWTGSLSTGYGTIGTGDSNENAVTRYAHRVSYEMTKGPIPDGLVIDHLCRVPRCVNPDHLEAVVPRENFLRGIAPGAISLATNTCARGHAFTPENTYVVPDGSRRMCRACKRLRRARHLKQLSGLKESA